MAGDWAGAGGDGVITFELQIPDSLKALLNGQQAAKAVERAVNRTALDAREMLADGTPKDTGDTARRWAVELAKFATGRATATVFNDSAVALYLEYGTGIYSDFPGAPRQVIKPRKARALGPVEWMGESGVFFGEVRGIRPHFIVRSRLTRIGQMLSENTLRELEGLFGG